MKEFELRFKKPENIEEKIKSLGFQKTESFKMHDLIFEPKSWEPGKDLEPGYFVIRLRLVENQKPLLEVKKFLEENIWSESSLEVSDPKGILEILSLLAVPRRVISKSREIWSKDGIIISLDDVEHLGEFIEIEGEENNVRNTVEKLNLKDPQHVYGRQLFYLEKEGKIKFDFREMEDIIKTFKYLGDK